MGLLKGALSLTRYRVLDEPPELTDEYISERLTQNAFWDIESSTEEESVGWVEVLNILAADFAPTSFNFGRMIILGLRVDTRRISPKVVQRYVDLAEAEAERLSDRPLSGDQRREIKSKVRVDLLARTPVTTDVYEVLWFPREQEVWLAASGVKIRERFEVLWHQTFKLGLAMKIPYVLAMELAPQGLGAEDLDRLRASALFGGGA